MKRYIFNGEKLREKHDTAPRFDVAVVGGDMAGLFTALELDRSLSVALVIKGEPEHASSWLAQGGICCVMGDDDSFEEHIADTLEAGAGHCNPAAVEVMVKEGPQRIKRLVEYGVPFDKEPDGTFHLTREGGHHKNRILHCGGDSTGKEITKALGKQALERSNITLFKNHSLVDILTDKSGAVGIVTICDGDEQIIKAPRIVIATGGAGQLYESSTTPEGNTGEGIAACQRAGCRLYDMEFVQFHPTGFAIHNEGERVFLISEAVRGEGARLINEKGEAFMARPGQHSLKELAPRDILTRAVLREMKATGSSCVYLDASSMTSEFFRSRFPTITAKCLECGINVPQELIPVCPTQHFLMGGVLTDLDGKTDVPGIFVCGEAACTGVHGANRLASNSTLECLVFGGRVAKFINENPKSLPDASPDFSSFLSPVGYCPKSDELCEDLRKVRSCLTRKVGAERKTAELESAKARLAALYEKYCGYTLCTAEGYKVFCAIQVGLEIASAALKRTISLGSHYIAD